MASYDSLSHVMSEHPELLVLRTFSALNIKTLLYYEAELAQLEVELQEIESEDQACGISPRQQYGADWKSLSASPDAHMVSSTNLLTQHPRDALQWQVFSRVRIVLREYSKTVNLMAKG